MSSEISNKWIPLSQLSAGIPYSTEYLSLLARKGKLKARKFDNVWHSTKATLDEYVAKHNSKPVRTNDPDELVPLAELAPLTPYSVEYLSLLARKHKLHARKFDNVWYATKSDINAYARKHDAKVTASPTVSIPAKKLFLHDVRRAGETLLLKAPEVKGLVPRSYPAHTDLIAEVLRPAPAHRFARMILPLAAALSLIVAVGTGFSVLERTSPLTARGIEEKALALAGSPEVASILEAFRALRDIAFGISPSSERTPIAFPRGTAPAPLAITDVTPSLDASSLKSELQSSLESYVRTHLSGLATPEPRIIYQTTSPVINTTVIREEILLADTRPTVTRQSSSDVDLFSRVVSRLTDGGTFVNGNFSGAVSGTGDFSILTFTNATGTSATTTNFFSTNASTTNFWSNVGSIGMATFASASTSALSISGTGQGLTFTGSGNHDITASAGTLRIGSNTIIGNIQALDDTVDIGTAAVRFDKIYANEVNASTLVGTLTGGNLIAETFNINSDNATADAEDSFLSFERGTEIPNALLRWDSTNDRFVFNAPLALTGGIGNGSLLVTSSSTLQNFTFVNATGTSATTTSLYVSGLASTTELRANTGVIGTLTATSFSPIELLVTGSSTLQNFTFTNATGTNATTTNLYVSGRASTTELRANTANLGYLTGGTGVMGNLLVTGSSTLQNFTFTNATGTSATTTSFYVSGLASTTEIRANTGAIGTLTTTSFSGIQLLMNGSSTLQNFTFTNATGTNATTTNLHVSGLASTTELRANTALFGGRVGIGSTTPSTLLSVAGTSTLQDILPGGTMTSNTSIYDIGSSTARWNSVWAKTLNVGTSTWSLNNGSDGRLSFFSGANGSGSERLSLLSGGNVGIGTTNPGKLLDVRGTFGAGTNGTEFTVSATGVVTGGTYNGQTISSAASLTGTLAVATSLSIAGGTALTTTNQTGTGSIVMSTSPTLTTPNIGAATGSSLNLGSGAITSGLINGQTISSAASFTGTLTTASTMHINQADGILQVNGVNRIGESGSYTVLYRDNGTIGMYLGGTDTGNYYDNTTHYFRGSAGVGTFLTLNGSTAAFGGTLTGGTYNSQTISSAASFTGTLTTAGRVGIGVAPDLSYRLKVTGVVGDWSIVANQEATGAYGILGYGSTYGVYSSGPMRSTGLFTADGAISYGSEAYYGSGGFTRVNSNQFYCNNASDCHFNVSGTGPTWVGNTTNGIRASYIAQRAGHYIYPGSSSGTDNQTSYYLYSNSTWGLQTNTSLNAAGLFDVGNRVCSSTTCSVGAITATTIDTGPGTTEVHLMNQNLRTTDNVQFNAITAIGNNVFGATNLSGLAIDVLHGVMGAGNVANRILVNDTSASNEYFLQMMSANGSDNEFLFRTDGTAHADGTWEINGADLAEIYIIDGPKETGDLVEIPSSSYEGKELVVHESMPYNPNIVGVVSTQPGFLAGAPGLDPGEIPDVRNTPVALSGRVPVKVSLENGPIKAGDALTSSSVRGVAMKATREGIIIGRALEDYDGTVKSSPGSELVERNYLALSPERQPIPEPSEPGVGRIMVFVHVGYWAPSGFAALQIKANEVLNNVFELTLAMKGVLIAWLGDASNGIQDFFAERVRTKELCVSDESGETCLTRGQLDLLLASATGAPAAPVGGGGGGSVIGEIEIISPQPEEAPASEPEPTPESEPATPVEETPADSTSSPQAEEPASEPQTVPEPQTPSIEETAVETPAPATEV